MEPARPAEEMMLDVRNPEIDVEDLMRRIQEKVQQRRAALPPDDAPAVLSGSSAPAHSAIEQTLSRAREVAAVGADLPAMSRTNGLARLVARPVAKAFLRIAQLITRDQRIFNLAVLDALRVLLERHTETTVQFTAEIRALRAEHARTEARLAALEPTVAQLRLAHSAAASRIAELLTSVSLQERRLGVLLEEARRRLPEPFDRDQLEQLASEAAHLDDARYLGLEDAFRGSRDEIKQRLAVYLPQLREGAGPEKRPILDIGCGRGELLEILRDEGLPASGVDSNHAAVDQCRALGLDAVAGDGFEVLRKIPDGSLGGLTAIHVVEHLPQPLVFKLLDEALRVLRPGGVAIFETPNPQNILVGACNFYIDPTHRYPVHPQTLHYFAEARGLVGVETLQLHPYPPEKRLPEAESALARVFNDYFYGPQDFAVVGRRP
jgi:SAM-dependent methyltransferase